MLQTAEHNDGRDRVTAKTHLFIYFQWDSVTSTLRCPYLARAGEYTGNCGVTKKGVFRTGLLYAKPRE